MTDELVPCPFCAGKATKLFLSGDGIVVRLYREATVYGCQICQVFRPSRADWNARTASTRPDSALGEELRERMSHHSFLATGQFVHDNSAAILSALRHPAPRADDALRLVEAAAIAARDAMLNNSGLFENGDGDEQIDVVLDAIRALAPAPPASE